MPRGSSEWRAPSHGESLCKHVHAINHQCCVHLWTKRHIYYLHVDKFLISLTYWNELVRVGFNIWGRGISVDTKSTKPLGLSEIFNPRIWAINQRKTSDVHTAVIEFFQIYFANVLKRIGINTRNNIMKGVSYRANYEVVVIGAFLSNRMDFLKNGVPIALTTDV